MYDSRLEERKLNFQKSTRNLIIALAISSNILEERENYRLTLRKEKVQDIIAAKRGLKKLPLKDLQIDINQLQSIKDHVDKVYNEVRLN
jgi:hypothetical protein